FRPHTYQSIAARTAVSSAPTVTIKVEGINICWSLPNSLADNLSTRCAILKYLILKDFSPREVLKFARCKKLSVFRFAKSQALANHDSHRQRGAERARCTC